MKRMFVAFAVLAVVAAGCSDDPDENQAAEDLVDELIDESSEPEPEPEADPEPEVDPEPEPEADPEPEAEPEPDVPVVEASDACLWLYHYTSDLFPDAPYHALIFGDLPDGPYTSIDAQHADSTDTQLSEFSGGWGFSVIWPVFGPGPVQLPTVAIDGVDITNSMSSAFFGGISEFTAASADPIDDEMIVPKPCAMELLHQVDKVVG